MRFFKKKNIKRTKYDKNAPYDNISVGSAGVIFGPVAGGILSYISLKNLGNRYAKYVLIGSFILPILFSYLLIFIIPDIPSIQLGFLWLIFMGFQQKQVQKWSEDNPNKKYKNGFKAFGWGILGLLLFIITYFVSGFLFIGSTTIDNDIDKDTSKINMELPY